MRNLILYVAQPNPNPMFSLTVLPTSNFVATVSGRRSGCAVGGGGFRAPTKGNWLGPMLHSPSLSSSDYRMLSRPFSTFRPALLSSSLSKTPRTLQSFASPSTKPTLMASISTASTEKEAPSTDQEKQKQQQPPARPLQARIFDDRIFLHIFFMDFLVFI